MEEFGQMNSENGGLRGSFLYASPLLGPPSGNSSGYAGRGNNSTGGNSNSNSNHRHHHHHHGPMGIAGAFQLQTDAAMVAEGHLAGNTAGHHQHHQQNRPQAEKFRYSLIRDPTSRQGAGEGSSSDVEAIKAKIVAHPQYSNLLEAYMDCQKIGAPSEVVDKLSAARQEFKSRQRSSVGTIDAPAKDPELDQFMEAYYDMLVKYREELTRPLQEAMQFMRRIEAQLNMLSSSGPVRIFNSDEKGKGVGSSEDEQDNSGGETDQLPEIDPRAEDRELKNHLLRKYSGYLNSLKQELSKKKKRGKLPKEARQKLLSWWELHYKWPYPSETEKVALAEATGLDQKQINNWFINQRKRHWKPSEDMQFMVMDGLHHPQGTTLYMEGHYIGDGPYRLGPGDPMPRSS